MRILKKSKPRDADCQHCGSTLSVARKDITQENGGAWQFVCAGCKLVNLVPDEEILEWSRPEALITMLPQMAVRRPAPKVGSVSGNPAILRRLTGPPGETPEERRKRLLEGWEKARESAEPAEDAVAGEGEAAPPPRPKKAPPRLSPDWVPDQNTSPIGIESYVGAPSLGPSG